MNAEHVAPIWRKTRRCDNSACVEVAWMTMGGVALRDSSFPDGPMLTFSRRDWAGFLADLRAERCRRP